MWFFFLLKENREKRGGEDLFVHIFMVSSMTIISPLSRVTHLAFPETIIIPRGVVNRFACENIIAVMCDSDLFRNIIYINPYLKFGTKKSLEVLFFFKIETMKNQRQLGRGGDDFIFRLILKIVV